LINRNFDEVICNFHSEQVIIKFKGHNSRDNLAKQLLWKKVYVAEDNGEIVGTGAFANFGDDAVPKYSVSNLYVLPEKHHQGIGRCIFNILKNDAMNQKAKSFHVPSTRNGVAFYKKMGFGVDEVQLDLVDEITWMTMKL
jgi:Acetyltransferase (GNAT) family.